MVNVNIIEGKQELPVDVDSFVKDYMDLTIPVVEIKKKYGLSQCDFNRMVKKSDFKRNPWDRRAKCSVDNPFKFKYYTRRDNNRFSLYKHINKKEYFFGTVFYEDEAKKCVMWLYEHDWNDDGFEEWLKENGIANTKYNRC